MEILLIIGAIVLIILLFVGGGIFGWILEGIAFRRFGEWFRMSLEDNPISYHSLLCHRCHLGNVWHCNYLTFLPRGFAAMRSHGDILLGSVEPTKTEKMVAK